jgi:glycosyltransferase involved in cell wall biosynthesis
MRVLCVHNRYQFAGGEGAVFDAEVGMLRQRGHDVETYEEDNRRVGEMKEWRVAARSIWSREAYRVVRERLRQRPCEVVHVTNFNPLISPSVYYAARRAGAAVVQSLHNYRLLCPGSYLMRDDRPCELCLTRAFKWPAVRYRCYRDHRGASAAVTAMIGGHRVLRTWSRAVDAYIALTRFARDKFIAGGLPADRLHVKPNFLIDEPHPGTAPRNGALFVGRLSREKGILDLVDVWGNLSAPPTLTVMGDGPLEEEVRRRAKGRDTIRILGKQDKATVLDGMRQAAFLVFPSTWYEGFPMTLLECFATECPVIVPGFGGMAELVDPKHTGIHYRPLDTNDLMRAISWAASHPEEMVEFGRAARRHYLERYTIDGNYDALMAIYEKAGKTRRTSGHHAGIA